MRIVRFRSFALMSVLAAGFFTTSRLFADPTIVNGSFESPAEPDGTITQNAGDGWFGSTLGKQYIISGNVQATANGGADYGTTPYGAQYLGLDARGQNRLPSVDSQTVDGFVAGTTYDFNVYFSNLAGATDSSVDLSISDGITGDYITDLAVAWQGAGGPFGSGTIQFQLATLPYLATTSGSLTLSIENDSFQGVMAIDNVSISVVPEPAATTVALLGAGVLAVRAVRRRSRTKRPVRA